MKYSLYRRELDSETVEYQIKPGWPSSTFHTSQWYDDRRIRDHVFKIYQNGLLGHDCVDEFNKPIRVPEYDGTDYWAIRFYPPTKYDAKPYYGLYRGKELPDEILQAHLKNIVDYLNTLEYNYQRKKKLKFQRIYP